MSFCALVFAAILVIRTSSSLSQTEASLSVMKKELRSQLESRNLTDPEDLSEAKMKIFAQSRLYAFLDKMPKGAVLHAHSSGMCTPDTIVQNVLLKDSRVRIDPNTLELSLRESHLAIEDDSSNSSVNLSEFLGTGCLAEETTMNECSQIDRFEDVAAHFAVSDEILSNLNRHNPTSLWNAIQNVFDYQRPLLRDFSLFKAYLVQSLGELQHQRVSHVEYRHVFGSMKVGNQFLSSQQELEVLISAVQEANSNSSKSHITVKFIYCQRRVSSSHQVLRSLEDAIALRMLYPEYVTAFDLVGDESLKAVRDLLTVLLDREKIERQYGIKINFIFHAGENEGFDVENLKLSLLLDVKRIGHGLAIVYDREVLDSVKQRGVCVEVCPLANMLFGYVKSLDKHPALYLQEEGVVISINPDAGGMFGYPGVTLDWLAITLEWDLSLAELRSFVWNSVYCSSLEQVEKASLYEMLHHDWKAFLHSINVN